MKRITIDYGIDLGTTNSCIAVVDPELTPQVIMSRDNQLITPSAVYIHKGKKLLVGRKAYQMTVSHNREDQENVKTDFKRRMGTNDSYSFARLDRSFSPEELSAEILKELRNAVENKRGENIDSCIITIPAAFEQPQIAATKRAAELAGFKSCELLQEPVAAALAYGILQSDAKGYWIVYDLGGGTFDAAVLQIQDGLVRIANHCGNNYLGGKDIDNLLLDRVILPKIQEEYDLPNFNRGEERWEYAISTIKYHIEKAKIELSRSESSEPEDFSELREIYDQQEEAVIDVSDFEYVLTREDLNPLIKTVIAQSINHLKELLKQSRLAPTAIEKMILVGGPTHYYLIRDALKSEFDIPLEFSIDPMTVVAQGAAVFASTRKKPVHKKKSVTVDALEITLEYSPAGTDDNPTIGGLVAIPNAKEKNLFSIELIHQQTDWRSGKVNLTENGAFLIKARANKGINEYTIELRDEKGSLIKTDPEALIYSLTCLEAPSKTLMHNISIGQADGSVVLIFRKGETLPLMGKVRCHPDSFIEKGSDDSLRIKLFEGTNERFAILNPEIGEVSVPAKYFPRDLNTAAEIEVIITLDENGNLSGTAEVLMFDMDEPYPFTWHTNGIYQAVDLVHLECELDKLKSRVKELQSSTSEDSSAANIFNRIEDADTLQQIDETFQAANNDDDSAMRCQNLIISVNEQLDLIVQKQERPELEKRANHALETMEEVMTDELATTYESIYGILKGELQTALQDSDNKLLDQATERMEVLVREILSQSPHYWIGGFQFAEANKSKMKDQQKADKLFAQARKAINDQKLEELKAAVIQLIRLLPTEEQGEMGEISNVWVD